MKVILVCAFLYVLIFICNAQNISLKVNYVYDYPLIFQIELDEFGNIDVEKLPVNVSIVDMNMDNRFDAFIFYENKLEMHYGLINGFSNNVSATWEFEYQINKIKGHYDRKYERGRLDIEFENGKTDIMMHWQNKLLLRSEFEAHPEKYQIRNDIPTNIQVNSDFQIIWEKSDLGWHLPDVNMLIGDVDQDGKKELIFQSRPEVWGDLKILYIYESTGNNSFELVFSYEDTVFAYGVKEITDLDADGNLEITALPGGGRPGWTTDPYFILFECTGDNSYNRFMIPAFVNIQEISPWCMRWVDSDLNGKPELVVGFERDVGTPSSYVHFYENINPGTFDRLHWWLQVYGSYLHGIAIGDLDNDGWGDIYVGRAGASTQLLRWEYDGYQSFDQKWFDTGLCSPMFPEIFDYDEDGLLEFVSISDFPGRSAILYMDAVGDDSLQIIALDSTSYHLGDLALWGRNWNRINNEYYISAPAEIYVPGPPSYFDGYGILLKRNPSFIYPFEPVFYSPVVESTAIHHALVSDLDKDNKVELITGKTFYPARVRVWEDQNVLNVINKPEIIPGFSIHVYPNPFNNSTKITYKLSQSLFVNLNIYSIDGRKIVKLINRFQQPGNHSVVWKGRDSQDRAVGSGVYIYILNAGAYKNSGKMILIK